MSELSSTALIVPMPWHRGHLQSVQFTTCKVPRVADKELSDAMRAVGAVLIEGPKACGKTATASRCAATVFDMDQDETARASIDLNPGYLFDQPTILSLGNHI